MRAKVNITKTIVEPTAAVKLSVIQAFDSVKMGALNRTSKRPSKSILNENLAQTRFLDNI